MSDFHVELDKALAEVEKARVQIRKGKTKQVTARVELEYIKSVAYAWSYSHRATLNLKFPEIDFSKLDLIYSSILSATSKNSLRTKYIDFFSKAKSELVDLRGQTFCISGSNGFDPEPNFARIISDGSMQAILSRRWAECQKCMKAEACLAATVMMGGLLEALFLTRANSLDNKTTLFKALSAPKDKAGKVYQLKDWTLRHYIDVGLELGWVSKTGKDVASVLRDYRNYVHPEKERTNDVILNNSDVQIFWGITKHLTQQLIQS